MPKPDDFEEGEGMKLDDLYDAKFHLYKYVTNLNIQSVLKYQNLRPVLVQEERKPPTPDPFTNVACQAGSF